MLGRLPDLDTLLQERDVVQDSVGSLLNTLRNIDGPDSPLGEAAGSLTSLAGQLDVDVSGLTETFPRALTTITNAMPAGTLEFVESIEGAYTTARDFVIDNPILKQIPEGGTLQEVALAVIDEALNLFHSRIESLTGDLVDADRLQSVVDTFARLQNLLEDYEAHSGELLPFVTQNLVGAGPDLLNTPLAHVQNINALVAPLQTSAPLELQAALTLALDSLLQAVEELTPTQAPGYARINTALDAVETGIAALVSGLTPVYSEAQQIVELPLWNTIFTTYRDLLDAVPIESVPTVDDLIDAIVEVLESLLARLRAVFDVDELRGRIDSMNASLRDLFIGAGISRVRQTLIEFIGQIEHAISQIPTEEVQTTVEGILGRVGQEVQALNLDQIGTEIELAFQTAENFIIDNLNEALGGRVQDAINQLVAQVQNLPLGRLVESLRKAVEELQTLIDELEAALVSHIDTLNGYLAQLEQLSFKPVGDLVIGEIDDIKRRLQAISPNALSDVERLAIRGALAVLEAIDLDTQVINGLKQGYSAAESQVKHLLNLLADALNRLRDQMRAFGPDLVMQPVNDLIAQINAYADTINARVLMRPLYEQIDNLADLAASISPSQLLTPLESPYNLMMETVHRLDPSTWVAPLEMLYTEIDRLIDFIDITPLFDELDRLQREWFAQARTAILDALDGLNLPEPLKSFFDGLRPVLEALTDALFGDPAEALEALRLNMPAHFRPTLLFEPLDYAYDQLVGLLHHVPANDLTTALNAVRAGVGVGLTALDPRLVVRTLRAGQAQLEELAPQNLLRVAESMVQIRMSFEAKAESAPPRHAENVATIRARLDAALALSAPGSAQIAPLIQAHDSLVNALRAQINQLDVSGAEEAYLRVRQGLERLLPDFLFSPDELTHAEIMTGFYAMRPSSKATRIEAALDAFLNAVEPLQDSLADGMNNFLGMLREIALLISPLSIKGAVEDVYAALRAKVRVLDPETLEASLRENVYDPLIEPLDAINPARLAERLNLAFERMVDALTGNLTAILDSLVGAIDDQLRAIRAALRDMLALIKDTIQTALASLQRVIDRLDQLVFVEILQRLERVIDNLGGSFEAELDRVRGAFRDMLGAAAPLGGSAAARVGGAV
jgi:hypothetical protein